MGPCWCFRPFRTYFGCDSWLLSCKWWLSQWMSCGFYDYRLYMCHCRLSRGWLRTVWRVLPALAVCSTLGDVLLKTFELNTRNAAFPTPPGLLYLLEYVWCMTTGVQDVFSVRPGGGISSMACADHILLTWWSYCEIWLSVSRNCSPHSEVASCCCR